MVIRSDWSLSHFNVNMADDEGHETEMSIHFILRVLVVCGIFFCFLLKYFNFQINMKLKKYEKAHSKY